ncbi:MAG: radical SAM protein [Methanoculleus sp.]|jgi:radical SAM protein with 4Fe4S-binding SPASM domain|nr:radical SAM protein [Methanoculleus sp.]
MTDDRIHALPAVRRWLGNPVARALLRFIIQDDECGNRLENAIQYYLNPTDGLCWRCRLAGHMVGHTLRRSSALFGVSEDDIKRGLGETVFLRGLQNVLTGIAHYGITMPQVVNAPFMVVWDFTHRCNLRCVHCYLDAQEPLPNELGTDEAKRLVEELADAGVVVIAFSGGEPLMRKDFFEVAAHAHKNDIYVALATNGTLITPEMAGRIRDAGVEYVEISVDGKNAASHDAMRGIPGAFDRTIAGVKNSVAAGFYTCIATTVTRANYAEIPEIYSLAADLGVNRLMCFNFIPTGRGVEMADQDIAPEERWDLMRYLLARTREGNGPEALTTAPQVAPVALAGEGGVPVGHFYAGEAIEGKTGLLADFIGGCGAGRLYCSIEPEGNVQPCVFLPIVVGNVRDTPFLDIWHSSEVLQGLRDRSRLSGSCADCSNKYICGGCRARGWAYFGDVHAPDPGCIKNRDYWESLLEREDPARPNQE